MHTGHGCIKDAVSQVIFVSGAVSAAVFSVSGFSPQSGSDSVLWVFLFFLNTQQLKRVVCLPSDREAVHFYACGTTVATSHQQERLESNFN